VPSPVPTPVAAVIGLVPAVLCGVRALPTKAVQLPVFAVSSVLTSLDNARRGYDDLALRGERLVARLRGTSFDDVEDRIEDALQGTPLAAPYDAVEDALEDAADTVSALVRKPRAGAQQAARAARTSAGKGLDAAADAVEDLAAKAAGTPAGAAAGRAAQDIAAQDIAAKDIAAQDIAAQAIAAQAPKGHPTPKAVEPDATRVTTAASSDVVDTVERVSAVLGGTVLPHDELPLPDYDHLTLGAVRGRMRSLDLPQLVQLRDYEQAKANRLPIVTMLDNRIAKLASNPSAPLSGGDVAGPSAKAASPRSPGKAGPGPAKVTPATAAEAPNAPVVAHGGLGGDQTR